MHHGISAFVAGFDRGQELVGQHAAHFARYAWHHRDPATLFVLEPDARRCAVMIVEDSRALGNLGLRPVVGGKVGVGKSRPPSLFQRTGDLLVQLHLAPENLCDRWLREIVAGRTKPTGGYDGAGSVERLAHRRRDPGGVVANGGPPNYFDSGLGEGARDVRGIGVDCKAEEELVTDGDQLDLDRVQGANTTA